MYTRHSSFLLHADFFKLHSTRDSYINNDSKGTREIRFIFARNRTKCLNGICFEVFHFSRSIIVKTGKEMYVFCNRSSKFQLEILHLEKYFGEMENIASAVKLNLYEKVLETYFARNFPSSIFDARCTEL